MWEPDYDKQAKYWMEKDAVSNKLDPEKLKERIDSFIRERKTCTLATGMDGFVRCTPIEYNFLDGRFYLLSEGGLKFKSLKNNKNVSIAIYDAYEGFAKLKGLQIQGTAEMIEPFSDEYLKILEYKHIPLEAMKKLPEAMNLIKVVPQSFDLLDSELKLEGVDVRQHLEL